MIDLMMWKSRLTTAPNIVSLFRLGSVPLLWFFAIQGEPVLLGLGILAAASTDVLDGYLARRLNQVTRLGSQLDSLADNTLILCTLVWLFMLCPQVLQGHNKLATLSSLVTYASFLVVMYFRCGRLGNLHLYSAKLSAVLGFAFVVVTFVFAYSQLLFLIAAGTFTLANIEGILVALTRPNPNEEVGSVFLRRTH